MSQSAWHIYSSVILRRMPMALPKPNVIEQRVQQIFNEHEISRSKLSDHELRNRNDRQRAERMASGEDLSEADIEAAAKQTAQDFEDQCQRELAHFLAEREASVKAGTDLASQNDPNKRSLKRHYDRDIMLVVRQHFGPTDPTDQWLLPQARVESGESLVDCGRRALASLMSQDFLSKCKFAGTLPASVYSFNYPRKLRDSLQATGAKVFFMRAYCPSTVQMPDSKSELDYQWLTRHEASQVLKAAYWKPISDSMFTEGRVDPKRVMEQVLRARERKMSATNRKTAQNN